MPRRPTKKSIRLRVTYPDQVEQSPEPKSKGENLRNKVKRLKLEMKKKERENRLAEEEHKQKQEVSQKIIDTISGHLEMVEEDARMQMACYQAQHDHYMLILKEQKKTAHHFRTKCDALEEEVKNKTVPFRPTCGICLLPFDENEEGKVPRILTECGHTICHECAGKFFDEGEIKCPFDRIITDVSKVTKLRKNHALFAD